MKMSLLRRSQKEEEEGETKKEADASANRGQDEREFARTREHLNFDLWIQRLGQRDR